MAKAVIGKTALADQPVFMIAGNGLLRCGLILAAFTLMWISVCQAQEKPLAELQVQATIPKATSHMAFGYGALWTMSDGQMVRINATDNSVAEIPIPGSDNAMMLMELDRYRGIAVGEDAIWLPDMASSSIIKIDPKQEKVVLTIPTEIFGASGSIGVGEGSVWVVTFDSHDKTLTRYNSTTGAMEARIKLPQASKAVMVAFGSVWVSAANRGELYRIDPNTNQVVATIPVHGATHLLAADDNGSIWLAFDSEGLVQRIDGQSDRVVATIATETSDMESDGDLAIGGSFVWMINRGSIISRIDPSTNSAKGIFRPPKNASNGRRIQFGSDSLWLSGNAIYRMAPPR